MIWYFTFTQPKQPEYWYASGDAIIDWKLHELLNKIHNLNNFYIFKKKKSILLSIVLLIHSLNNKFRSKKMKIFVTNRQMLAWVYMYPIDETATIWQKTANIVFSSCVFLINFCSTFSAGTFIFQFMSVNLEESLYAVLQTYLLINGTVLLLFISIYYYTEAFYKMFQHSVRRGPHKNLDDKEFLRKLVQFHILIKE